MRVLVLGGSGFVGAAAVRRLRERGGEVVTFHRSEGAGIRGDRGDLGAHREAFRRLAPDVVLDTIAYTGADASATVAAFRGVARRLVVLSSQDVYAAYGRLLRLETGAADPAPSSEDSPLRDSRFPYRAMARGPEEMAYGYEKILVELEAAAGPALPATILRLPCVYGPGDRHHRVGQVIGRMRAGEPFLLDRAKARWRWTRGYVEDVAEAIALAATDPHGVGRVYNVGEEEALTERDWVGSIGRAARWSGEVREVDAAALPPDVVEPYDFSHDLVSETRRIREELGFQERVARDEAVAASVAWERATGA